MMYTVTLYFMLSKYWTQNYDLHIKMRKSLYTCILFISKILIVDVQLPGGKRMLPRQWERLFALPPLPLSPGAVSVPQSGGRA